jgi:hypothetical protein
MHYRFTYVIDALNTNGLCHQALCVRMAGASSGRGDLRSAEKNCSGRLLPSLDHIDRSVANNSITRGDWKLLEGAGE